INRLKYNIEMLYSSGASKFDTMKHELPVLLYEYIVLRYWVAQRVWCGFPNVHSKLCEYQRSYLYFDARHNTEKAQESFAHLLFGADPNVVQPINIRELITYPKNQDMSEFWKEPVGDILLLDDGIDVKVSGSM
ncbi:BnaA08g29210D, partial [Brassica napus]